jgi:hypothetical protein
MGPRRWAALPDVSCAWIRACQALFLMIADVEPADVDACAGELRLEGLEVVALSG